VQVDNIKPSFLESNATRLTNLDRANAVSSHGGAVQVDSIKARVESACGVCNQRLKLQYDELLSNFSLKFNLRRFTEVEFVPRRTAGGGGAAGAAGHEEVTEDDEAG